MINSLLSRELCETPLSQEIKCSVNCERSVLGKGLGLDQGSSTLGMPQLPGLFKGCLESRGAAWIGDASQKRPIRAMPGGL